MRSGRFARQAGNVLRTVAFLAAGLALAGPGTPRPRPVALVVWDGACWPILDPLLAARKLPSLDTLLRRGRAARLATLSPPLAAPVATTLATGLSPELHGVADASEIDAASGNLRGASALSWRVPAIWDVASARGLAVAVIGWPATWPASEVAGVLASDRLLIGASRPEGLQGFTALAFPADAANAVARIAARGKAGGPLGDLRDGVRIRFEAARELAPASDLTLLFVPEAAQAARLLYDPASSAAGDVRTLPPEVEKLFVETDRQLGLLAAEIDRRGGDLFVVSTAGLAWAPPAERRALVPPTRAPEGILVAAGADVLGSRVRTRAAVADLTPTLCRLLGLPRDPRSRGTELSAWIAAGAPPPVPGRRWDDVVTVRLGDARVDAARAARDAAEHAERLASLGYLVPQGPFRPAGDAPTRSPAADANLGITLRAEGRADDAILSLRRAVASAPGCPEYRELLADLLEDRGRLPEADEEAVVAALARGTAGPWALVERAQRRAHGGRRSAALGLLRAGRKRVAEPAREITIAYGRLSLEAGQPREALRIARLLVKERPEDAVCWTLLGDACARTGASEEARRARARAAALAGGGA